MKNIIYLILISCFLSLTADSQTLNGNGNVIQKEIPLNAISKISNLVSANIFITNSYSDKLILEIDENLVNNFQYELNDNDISITSNKKGFSPTKFNLYFSVSRLNAIENKGSGDINTTNVIQSENFSLLNAGSGNCNIKVNSKNLNSKVTGSGNASIESDADICNLEQHGSGSINLSNKNTNSNIQFENNGSGNSIIKSNSKNIELFLRGSGDVKIEGYSLNFTFHSLGSGDLDGQEFNTDNCDAKLSGSGDAEFYCNNTADIQILGSGDLKLHGECKINKISTLGSGKLIKK